MNGHDRQVSFPKKRCSQSQIQTNTKYGARTHLVLLHGVGGEILNDLVQAEFAVAIQIDRAKHVAEQVHVVGVHPRVVEAGDEFLSAFVSRIVLQLHV